MSASGGDGWYIGEDEDGEEDCQDAIDERNHLV